MHTQPSPGISRAEMFPGLSEVLEHWIIGAAIFGIVAMIYLFIQWGIAHSRMEDIDSDALPFDVGFVTAISLPLILLSNMGSTTGLIIGAAIGVILALVTYLLLRRYRATHPRTTR